jgi:hypothetical protein
MPELAAKREHKKREMMERAGTALQQKTEMQRQSKSALQE